MLAGQISIPGYLKLNFFEDLRVEKEVAAGGGGRISFGVMVNSDLRAKYPTFADSVAIKHVDSPDGLTPEEVLSQFHQEVSVMK